MKNLIYFLIFLPGFLKAQDTCTGLENIVVIHPNRIGASLYPHGYKFYGEDGFFKVPYTSQSAPSTIFAANAWIGAYRDGQLKIAAQDYVSENAYDYQVGPLLGNATPLDSACLHFNRTWSVKRTDITRHITDYESDGIIDDTLASIFGWPAEGNIYFKDVNSFSLPLSHQGGWADFYDKNQNGLYEPHAGEYPCIYLNGEPYLPEVMMWMVFNDQGSHTSSMGDPLGVEIQLTVYGFNCTDNPVLNNALFNSYKIINQHDLPLDSMLFGMWTDYDLGCAYDDYIGCDTTRHTEFVYNSDVIDGDAGNDCTNASPIYGAVPPVQSFTYLSHPMYSFTDGRIHDTTSVQGYYNALKGLWPDGLPITVFDKGYNPGSLYPTTKFLFSGDPRDTAQWSQLNENVQPGDKRTLSSISLGQLDPYETVRIDGAYIYHQDSSFQHLDMISLMHSQVDAIRSGYADGNLACIPFEDCEATDCVWPGDFNHDGKSDHFDLLAWGVALDQQGSSRNGLFDWDGYHADPWSLNLPGGHNAKYADGNGDGLVDILDLETNIQHYSLTNPLYEQQHLYPAGPHVYLISGPISASGSIRNFNVRAGQEIPNVLGLAYEIEYDTSLFTFERMLTSFPSDSNFLGLLDEGYVEDEIGVQFTTEFAFVQTDHQPIIIPDDFRFQREWVGLGFNLRPELSPDDVPDSTIIRLRNLIAIDAEGNNLHIGSEPLVVYKEGIVGSSEPTQTNTLVYPNPTTGKVQILSDIETEVRIFSIQGHLLKHFDIREVSRQIDVSFLPSGIYILRMLATGESIKLIIE
ncbi:MAG TPA: T9SS type A sorting domain-containing protein [Saprospiraceae bacterium]|nr:T9SS type A sorting domain-containing protein [Saprospiraceae bacterium]